MGLFSKKKEETAFCCCGGSCTPETPARAEAVKATSEVRVPAQSQFHALCNFSPNGKSL